MGYTPLHQAAQQGHIEILNILLKYGADPNLVSRVTNNFNIYLEILLLLSLQLCSEGDNNWVNEGLVKEGGIEGGKNIVASFILSL